MIQFVTRYERALASRRRAELEADFEVIKTIPKLFVSSPMLKQAAENYTQSMFKMFESKHKDQLLFKIEDCGFDDTIYRSEVTQERYMRGIVTFVFVIYEVMYSCKKFEFTGILCRHIIKLLYHRNIHEIPIQFIIKRWTRGAKSKIVRDQGGNPILADPRAYISLRYNELCRKAVSFVLNCSTHEELYLLDMGLLDNGLKELDTTVKKIEETPKDVSKSKNAYFSIIERAEKKPWM
ncbi:hypothetical protein GIB67_027805 [Kingdonia uniflora]|uniref:Protein FAR1-RELATED SEQUENCE n=1 Tax=Kingdonia uniflora TaxID=39325 RepID=A0A7J7PC29_9MAGN|nr:hypothetical protein GIB67_027805 [Kingdonia uniflora]